MYTLRVSATNCCGYYIHYLVYITNELYAINRRCEHRAGCDRNVFRCYDFSLIIANSFFVYVAQLYIIYFVQYMDYSSISGDKYIDVPSTGSRVSTDSSIYNTLSYVLHTHSSSGKHNIYTRIYLVCIS